MGYIIASFIAILIMTLIVYKVGNKLFGLGLRIKPILLCAVCAMLISLVLPKIIVGFAGLPATIAVLAIFAIVFAYFVAKCEDKSVLVQGITDEADAAGVVDIQPQPEIPNAVINQDEVAYQSSSEADSTEENVAVLPISDIAATSNQGADSQAETANEEQISGSQSEPEAVESNIAEEQVPQEEDSSQAEQVVSATKESASDIMETEIANEEQTSGSQLEPEAAESNIAKEQVPQEEEVLQAEQAVLSDEESVSDIMRIETANEEQDSGSQSEPEAVESNIVEEQVPQEEDISQAVLADEESALDIMEPETANEEQDSGSQLEPEAVDSNIAEEQVPQEEEALQAVLADEESALDIMEPEIANEEQDSGSQLEPEAAESNLEEEQVSQEEEALQAVLADEESVLDIMEPETANEEQDSGSQLEPETVERDLEEEQPTLQDKIPETQSVVQEAGDLTMEYNESTIEPVQIDAENLDDLLELAFVSKESQDYSNAFKNFKKALALYPNSEAAPFLVVEIGNILKNKGNYDEAIKIFSDGRNLSQTKQDDMMEQEFISTIAYLRITKNILLQNRLGDIPFTEIPPQILNQIDEEFREWRSVGNI